MMKTLMLENEIKGLNRTPTNKVVVLHSGGVESTALIRELKKQGKDIFCVYFDYGQPNKEAESWAAQKTSAIYGVEEGIIVKATDMVHAMMLGAVNDEEAYVPFRNTIFMVLASMMAHESNWNADGIAIGCMQDDIGVFGDNDPIHHQLMEIILSKSCSRPMKVYLPLLKYTKPEIIELLKEDGAFKYTVSCWNATIEGQSVKVCGKCAQCAERGELVD